MGSQLLSTQPVAGPLGSPFVLLATDGAGVATGVTFGTFETGATVGDQFFARALRFRGHQTWVVVQGDSIYRTTDAGASWSTVFGPDADLGTTVCKSGLHLVYPNGVATLMFMARHSSTTTSFSVFSSIDGVTWTKTGPVTLAAQSTALQANCFWQGGLFCAAGLGGSARTFRVDCAQRTITQYSMPNMNGTQNDCGFAVFNDRLFGIWTNSSLGTVSLYEFLGTQGWVLRITSLAAAITTFAADRKIALFVQGANMYAIFMIDNPDFPVPDPEPQLWKCIEIDSALATTDRTTPLASIHGGETPQSRVTYIADAPIAGGGIPEISLYFAPDGVSGTGVAVYRWNGAFSGITPLAGGNNVQNAWPFGVQYGGNPFWTAGDRAIECLLAFPVLGGVRWSYRLYSPNGSPDLRDVRARYGRRVDEYTAGELSPHDNVVLSNPSHGTLIGQTIVGLDTADNGATDFQVTWLFANQTQLLENGDFAKTTLEVF